MSNIEDNINHNESNNNSDNENENGKIFYDDLNNNGIENLENYFKNNENNPNSNREEVSLAEPLTFLNLLRNERNNMINSNK